MTVPKKCGECRFRGQMASGMEGIPFFWVCTHPESTGRNGEMSFINLDDDPDLWCPIVIHAHLREERGFIGYWWYRLKVWLGIEDRIYSLLDREAAEKMLAEKRSNKEEDAG